MTAGQAYFQRALDVARVFMINISRGDWIDHHVVADGARVFVGPLLGHQVVDARLHTLRLPARAARRRNSCASVGERVRRKLHGCEVSDGGLLAGQPAACTLIEYSGPVDQKSLINRVRVEADADQVTIQEVTRIILARRLMPGDTRNFPPITTDQEVLTSLDAPVGGTARGRLRLVSYLQPLDPLYFAAGGKSVSISDYSLELRRL